MTSDPHYHPISTVPWKLEGGGRREGVGQDEGDGAGWRGGAGGRGRENTGIFLART